MISISPELVCHVPGCEAGEAPRSVQALTGGRGVNGVWRVQTGVGDFVLRLRHDPVDRPGSFSRTELASHGLAAAAGIAPRLVAAAPDGRWLVMEFVGSPAWSEAQLLSHAGLDALGGVLQRLHALECPALPRMDAVAIARGYLELIATRHQDQPGATAELAVIEREASELARLSDRAVLNHGDLMTANLLGPGSGPSADTASGKGPVLVDWEYAQRADPTWDVACLLAYYPDLERRLDRLLPASGLSTADDRRILSLQRRLFAGLNDLWQRAEALNWIS